MSSRFFSQNSSELQSILSEHKNFILKAYSTQKVGSGGNFESENTSLRPKVWSRHVEYKYDNTTTETLTFIIRHWCHQLDFDWL